MSFCASVLTSSIPCTLFLVKRYSAPLPKPIRGGGHAHFPLKDAAKVAAVGEAGGHGDVGDAQVTFLQQRAPGGRGSGAGSRWG